jgi:hypothetical protein
MPWPRGSLSKPPFACSDLTFPMKPIALLLVAFLFLGSVGDSQQVKSFRDEQFRYPRVRLAAKEKDDALRRMFEEKRISYPPRAVLFGAFKKEALLAAILDAPWRAAA